MRQIQIIKADPLKPSTCLIPLKLVPAGFYVQIRGFRHIWVKYKLGWDNIFFITVFVNSYVIRLIVYGMWCSIISRSFIVNNSYVYTTVLYWIGSEIFVCFLFNLIHENFYCMHNNIVSQLFLYLLGHSYMYVQTCNVNVLDI